jgi:cell division protein FtsZ
MNIRLQVPSITDLKPRIAVVGVGGAGCNAINNMIASGLAGVNFIAANTDAQALAASSAEQRIQLGVTLTEGLGAGSKPEIGQAAAEEALDEIRSHIAGSHMLFIAAGMGGGTGTGAAAVIARAAKELDILVVGVVTKPFHFEGQRRLRIAEAGIAELRKHVDTLIVIPNQNLFRVANEKTTFAEAFMLADQVLYSGIACIVDLIVKEGLINLDFADVRTIMSGMGTAMMGTGEATGERRAILAAEEAIANPLLDDVSLRGAKGLLLSIIGGRDLTLYEVDEAASRVRQEVDPEANIIVGATFDESLADRVRVSIVASGMTARQEQAGEAATAQARPGRHPQSAPGAAPASAPTEPRAAAKRPLPAGPDDFMNALSRAIDDDAAHSDSRKPREMWKAPGNVLIEEGLQPMTHAPVLPGLRHGRSTQETEPFIPSAPAEVKRAQRRLPVVEDFPPIAQREYRAKSGHQGFAADEPQASTSAPPQETRKAGLLSRITGFRRRTDESQKVHKEARQHMGRPLTAGSTSNHPHAQGRQDLEHVDNRERKSLEDIELPGFFERDRRRP